MWGLSIFSARFGHTSRYKVWVERPRSLLCPLPAICRRPRSIQIAR